MTTHWGGGTHICISKLTIIGSDNGLLSGWRQAIIWINAEILLIGPLGTNFSEISIKIYTFSFKKMHFKVSSGKWGPSCLCIDVLTHSNIMLHVMDMFNVFSALHIIWAFWYDNECIRSRYQGQGQVITSHNICGMSSLGPALDTCFWHIRFDLLWLIEYILIHWGWVRNVYISKLCHHWFR